MACTFRLEKQAWHRGFARVAGLDEAGRGCLFGPVFAAAVVLDPAAPIRGLNDSKVLVSDERTRLAALIRQRSLAWAVAEVDAAEIDRINILEASRKAMKLALERLSPPPDFLLVDALWVDSRIEQRAVIHGDALSRSIAAASILAKVGRDQSMESWHERFPQYGLAAHKGYGTPRHLKALAEFGPTPFHRMSFEPVRAAAGIEPQLALFAEA